MTWRLNIHWSMNITQTSLSTMCMFPPPLQIQYNQSMHAPWGSPSEDDCLRRFNCSMRADRQQNSLEFGEAKVSNLGSVWGGEQDVHGLEVKVKDRGVVVVEVHHARADIPCYLVKLCMVQGRSVQHISHHLGKTHSLTHSHFQYDNISHTCSIHFNPNDIYWHSLSQVHPVYFRHSGHYFLPHKALKTRER